MFYGRRVSKFGRNIIKISGSEKVSIIMIPRHCFKASSLCLILLLVIKLLSQAQSELINDQESESDEVSAKRNQEEGETEEEEVEANKFNYKTHPEDHGVYAHRSLISQDYVKKHEDGEEGADEDYAALKTEDFVQKEWLLMFRHMDASFDSISSSFLERLGKEANLFDEIVTKLPSECKREIYYIRDSLKKHKLWAVKMVDANGKLLSGLTYGRFASPGDYEECLSIRVDETVNRGQDLKNLIPEHHKFHGKYCLLDFRLPMPERPKDKLLGIHDPVIDLGKTELGKMFPDMVNYSSFASVFYEVGYLHAFCLPSTCHVKDLVKSFSEALEGLHFIVNNTVDCQEIPDEPEPLSRAQIISMTLLIVLFGNAFFASALHYLLPRRLKRQNERLQEESKDISKFAEAHTSSIRSNFRRWATKLAIRYKPFADCFSIQKNFDRLAKPDPRGLTFVHYTRIVAMALTVITHTAAMGTLQAITKPADASNSQAIFRDFFSQMLANAFSSIQIFFFMAGFMLVVSTHPSFKRDPTNISFVEYAIKRAIRLMPGLIATIVINFLWPLLFEGPMLSYFKRMIVEPCETNWWRTIFFLSNFDHVERMCIRHSYFSASDYQLHIMAFPLLLLLNKKPILALVIAGVATLAGFVAQVVVVLTKTVMPFLLIDYIDKEAFFNVVHYIHHPVWNHMSAFFYGFIIGYFVVKQIRVDLSETTIKRLWCIIMPLGLISIFAPYYWNHYKKPIHRWQMVLYVIFDRFILLSTCAWLSYATMVLARPKPKTPIEAAPTTNLPKIITLDQQQEKKEEQVTESENRLNLDTISSSSMPRQRSSPNLLTMNKQGPVEHNLNSQVACSMRPVASSSNVIGLSACGTGDQLADTMSSRAPKPEAKPTSATPVKKANVSNVNTLCLILSRLTFQLYLFNMVVLWIDVNHSKYFWFFSYYFIITKALGVYIFSSILAMIFFVTLESPTLTLYIMWVKSRAEARAKKRTGRDLTKVAMAAANKDDSMKQQRDPHVVGPKSSPESQRGASDGLHMRIGKIPHKPSFSFIDLSVPTPQQSGGDSGGGGDSQTRM